MKITKKHVRSTGNSAGGIGAAPLPQTQREIGRELTLRMLDLLADEPRYQVTVDGEPLHQLLRQLVEATWPANNGRSSLDNEQSAITQREALMQRLLQCEDAAVKDSALELLTHAGHLHQLGGVLAREVMLESSPEQASSMRRFLYREPENKIGLIHATADEALAALGRPTLEFSLTGHPTNNNSIVSMQKQRALVQAIYRARREPDSAERHAEVDAALKAFGEDPLLIPNGKKKVREETETMLYFLRNAFTDIHRVYGPCDKELSEVYHDQYDPMQLKLNLRFHSWGSSGDKDGNPNVTATTTLHALAAHYQAGIAAYLEAIEEVGVSQPLAEWQVTLLQAQSQVNTLTEQLTAVLDSGAPLSPEEFDAFSQRLRGSIAPLDLEAFKRAAVAAHETAAPDAQQATLKLCRNLQHFGFGLSTIEYRETAERYEEVAATLIPEYATLIAAVDQARQAGDTATLATLEAQRVALLTDYLRDPAKLQQIRDAFGTQGWDKAYDKSDWSPITYQTLKRMELARDFPQMIQNNVLAECQGTSNMLEALLLQHVVAPDREATTLRITPLFEEAHTLAAAPKIVRDALENADYAAHVAFNHFIQEVQFAHSDNRKRSGTPAATGLLYESHKGMQEMFLDLNQQRAGAGQEPLVLHVFEGLGHSDSGRGGRRPLSSMIKQFGLETFFKTTLQGVDLLNRMNLPATFQRLMLRLFSTSAATLSKEMGDMHRPMSSEEKKLADACRIAKEDFDTLYEDPNYAGFLEAIGYGRTSESGNDSSRPGRKQGGGALKVQDVRAIGVSETQQHAEFSPTWVGSLKLPEAMQQAGISLAPTALHHLYENSAAYRDMMDQMLYGLSNTCFKNLFGRVDATDIATGVNELIETRFIPEYRRAFRLSMESYTGKALEKIDFTNMFRDGEPIPVGMTRNHAGVFITDARQLDTGMLRNMVIHQVFPHVADVMGDRHRFLGLVDAMETALPSEQSIRAKEASIKEATPEDAPALQAQVLADKRRFSLVTNARRTVFNGLEPLIDDPSYAKLHCQTFAITRPWVQNGVTAKG